MVCTAECTIFELLVYQRQSRLVSSAVHYIPFNTDSRPRKRKSLPAIALVTYPLTGGGLADLPHTQRVNRVGVSRVPPQYT